MSENHCLKKFLKIEQMQTLKTKNPIYLAIITMLFAFLFFFAFTFQNATSLFDSSTTMMLSKVFQVSLLVNVPFKTNSDQTNKIQHHDSLSQSANKNSMALLVPLTKSHAMNVAEGIANPVSDTLARVVPGDVDASTLGAPGASDVFVTNASEISGLDAGGLAQKLTIPEESSYKVIEFPTDSVSGISSPINRMNPGFVGGGQTAGGASEFVIPNGPIPEGANIRIV